MPSLHYRQRPESTELMKECTNAAGWAILQLYGKSKSNDWVQVHNNIGKCIAQIPVDTHKVCQLLLGFVASWHRNLCSVNELYYTDFFTQSTKSTNRFSEKWRRGRAVEWVNNEYTNETIAVRISGGHHTYFFTQSAVYQQTFRVERVNNEDAKETIGVRVSGGHHCQFG